MNTVAVRGGGVGIGRWLLTAALLGALLVPAILYVPTSIRQPWDLETYQFASRAAAQGLNPYDTASLARVNGGAVGMPFLYPPVTVPLLAPLAALPLDRATQVWSWIQLLLLASLVTLWRRYFIPDFPLVLLAVVAVFGFNAAAVWDVRSGNVALVELLLLWAGFAAYTHDRRRVFAACVVAAALFKLAPAAFLLLLLVPSRERGPDGKLLAASVVVLAGLVLAPAFWGPSWARGYLDLAPGARPTGVVNPSFLGMVDTLLGSGSIPLTHPPFHALMLLIAFDATILGISVPTLRRLWRRRDPREWVLASAMLFALLSPRMMIYSYLMLPVPALALVGPALSRIGGRVMVAALLVAQGVWSLSQVLLRTFPGFMQYGVVRSNLSFLMILIFWMTYLIGSRAAPPPPARGDPRPATRRRRAESRAPRRVC